MLGKKDSGFKGIDSIISSGVVIKGEFKSQGSVRIDGQIEGNLNVNGDLIIGEKGNITGEIKAENIVLAGRVDGSVFAKGRLGITSTGRMQGDIKCTVLTIDEGGQLEGSSIMSRREEKTETNKAT